MIYEKVQKMKKEKKQTKEQIEKELLEGIEQTKITSIPRELLDDMKVSYLVLTSQLLGLRQGYELGINERTKLPEGFNHRKKPRKEECRCGGKMFQGKNGEWFCESEGDGDNDIL